MEQLNIQQQAKAGAEKKAPAFSCASCGRENRDSAKFCRFCGGAISDQAQGVPAAPVIPPPQSSGAAQNAPPAAPPAGDYIGLEAIRAELGRVKKNITVEQERAKHGIVTTAKTSIFIFRGNTGTGKTLVAASFIADLKQAKCLESERVTTISARALARQYKDEFALAVFMTENKPAALIIDEAAEDSAFLHELLLALGKSQQNCVCMLSGLRKPFEEFFENFPEDKQRVTQFFEFPDQSAEDLSLILEKKLREKNYIFDPALNETFTAFIEERRHDPLCEHRNGWLIEKDVVPSIEKKQGGRLSAMDSPSGNDWRTILEDDIPLKNKKRTIDEILSELDSMIGLGDVKKAVREIANKIQIQKEIEAKHGAKSQGEGNNIIITGNPGTGKTTVVRTLGALFKAIGLLKSDIVTETDGNSLKGSYLGQSKDNVNNICEKAMGGILFVDEAYTLANDKGAIDSFAEEAATTLMKRLEDDRARFVGVAAGYPLQMEWFLDKINPGMRRRFKHFLHLDDYTAEELCAIFDQMAGKAGYSMTSDAKENAHEAVNLMYANKSKTFGNAGEIRQFFERVTSKQSSRLSALSKEEREPILKLITHEDIPYEKPKVLTVDDILADLDSKTGMAAVKKTVREIANKIRIQKEIEEQEGTKGQGEGNNIIITGNPGTGKTTVVRILGSLFKAIGLLPSDKVIETDGNGLKGAYIGQTKDLVNEQCEKAMGGILFIDEAYTLANEQGPVDSFAKEAAETLLKRLEDDRAKFVGIAAGYAKEMEWFLDKLNPGMRRRFKHFLHLDDYTAEELCAIFDQMVKQAGYTITGDAAKAAHAAIQNMVDNKGPNFGNAGTIRMFFEQAVSRQASRISLMPKADRANVLKHITADDIEYNVPVVRTVDEILSGLDAMIGLGDVKKAVREIANKLVIQKERDTEDGTDYQGEGNNIIITGNPGTGKTTVVRTLGALFKAIGLLPTDTVIETDGNGLKGSYLGQSKDKVNDFCKQARGGILFVDEAYTLASENGAADQYSQEAAETLMKHLEDDRTRMVGVAAGYPRQMEWFLDKINPGMRRRFKHFLHLPDYTAQELCAIFEQMTAKAGFTLNQEAKEKAQKAITAMHDNKGPNFGNAGEIRIFFERATSRQSSRLADLSKEERASMLKVITAEDIPLTQGAVS
jgi:SpoVK/Ycf46/Vps4 family AAA+-type ATPase